ncbi:MAG: leucyl/phenylalanyl-tRNA--protein transferase [Ekhidna sp.]|nr:leucyl/phenylalanyl-tRNA--protein transferase [Ekhidna sp.]MBC6411135.1 leucyl/phenylalanyl-tRNA--protein transferase [Ekhidna sp.]
MPVFYLTDDLIFPPVSDAEEGVVAIGGDLSPERLMLAYRSGIFPWYNEEEPIFWWSPNPRFVLFPRKLHISGSMKRILKRGEFTVSYDQDFDGVISQCKRIARKDREGTWITDEMKQAYIQLHTLGHAKSIEVRKEGELVGGMYGIDLGKVFCGESMFSKVSNASKVALIYFLSAFEAKGGRLLDCQVYSDHLASMGAEEIDRITFLNML